MDLDERKVAVHEAELIAQITACRLDHVVGPPAVWTLEVPVFHEDDRRIEPSGDVIAIGHGYHEAVRPHERSLGQARDGHDSVMRGPMSELSLGRPTAPPDDRERAFAFP
jgi:hypothetical protein